MLETTGTPLVTISVLAYGPSPWLRDVVAAVREHTTLPYELVLVDNGTPPETAAFLQGVEDARVLHPGRNLGFGGGHDFAANHARGTYFCVLNSDALVGPGWLDALVAPLVTDPTIGATAPVYVYPDGRLQEAGAAVEPSGQVIAFGRFDDPATTVHRAAGRVPFASAACLVTRTATFRTVGGFDVRYGAAYYEDVDLAFALRDRGLHVHLVADVQVVHAQGASSETSADAQRLLLGNRERFRSRWAAELGGRPFVYARPEAHHLAAARDFDACDRVVVIAPHLAAPGTDEFAARLVDALRTHLRDGRVSVLAGAQPSASDRDAWLRRGVEVFPAQDAIDLLGARRFHYAAAVVVEPAPATTGALVRDTQPQARLVDAPANDVLDDEGAFDRWLTSLDLVPRLVPLGAPR